MSYSPIRPAAGRTSAAFLALLLSSPVFAQTGETTVSNTRAVLEQWTETRRILSKEKSDWVVGKESLTARLDVVKREIVAIQRRIGETRGSVAEADKKRDQLLVDSNRLQTLLGKLEQEVATLELRTVRMLARLPDPLREKIKPLTQLLPVGDQPSKLQVDVRFGNVIAILNELNKWNREITATSEVRHLADGSSVEVTVLYLGLGQAYYANSTGKVAGSGRATADGWQWVAQNELGPEVQRAISMFKNELTAAFVRLPVQIL